MLWVASGLGFLIGLVLGLLGGGGSILTVPALVYIIGQSPQAAVTASLMIVGSNSAVGAIFHGSQGSLNWRVALLFGGSGMLLAYFAAGLSGLFAPTLLLLLFAVLMLVVGLIMILKPTAKAKAATQTPSNWMSIVSAGAVVGILTGLLGVGGGFLIVPALVMLVGLPMQQAIGTSLIIIAMNSAAGLLGHLDRSSIDFVLIGIFAITGLIGTFAGTRLAHHIANTLLQRLFALFIIALAIVLLIDNASKLF